MPKRQIKITCTGAALAKLEDLVPLQGDLKKLDAERYKKLKRALLEHGFSFPFFVWKDAGKLKLLDGHQRDRVLRRLKAQGYEIPPLPIAFIQAADETEARKKILLLSSQYGEMTDESLMQFLNESDIDLDDIMDSVVLPGVDIEKLSQTLEQELNGQVEAQEDGKQYQVIVECGDKKQQKQLVAKLKTQGLRAHAQTLDPSEKI
jgi:ParB-like nuclease domain.